MSGNDERFVDDVTCIVQPKPTAKQLDAAGFPLPIDGTSGSAQDPLQVTTGIASPITETKYIDREFYPTVTLTSTDGVFSFDIMRLKTLKMSDAKSRSVILKFQDKV